MAALLTHFGGEILQEDKSIPEQDIKPTQETSLAQPVVNQKRINLEKKLEKQAPAILNLSKKAKIM
ncbi:hypothetical protein [Ectobacillus panaciterrae]|uniref:hypothetical protein n=1 Tax=Ectobacillus panaciterrae TaxID=363872 RepID=UPI0004246DA7|nr:hypothetical protein [Ectobacillus panaciterrae]